MKAKCRKREITFQIVLCLIFEMSNDSNVFGLDAMQVKVKMFAKTSNSTLKINGLPASRALLRQMMTFANSLDPD